MHRMIGAASGWGAQRHECEEGPHILKEAGLLEKLRKDKIAISQWKMLYPERQAKDINLSKREALPIINDFNSKLAEEVERTLRAKEFPIILGGDHSIAVGTWNGAYRYFEEMESLPMGLIWIDAHMDSHTPKTTPSGAYHGMPLAALLGAWQGMPLAALLGYGEPMISEQQPKEPVLLPENICLVGTRSFEEGEAELLRRMNVRIFFSREIEEKGMEKVMQEAIAHVTKKTKVFGVSLDLDVITPEEAPGVGSPEKNGVKTKDLLKGLALLRNHPNFKAFEIVEYNPQRNHHAQTAALCYQILSQVMKTNE